MRREDIRAFVRRDWYRLKPAKLQHWARVYATQGALPLLRAADALRAHVIRCSVSTRKQERALDLAEHVRLKKRIDAANARVRP